MPKSPDDAKKVLAFIAFTCPVCAGYHSSLANWGRTLPKGWQLEFVPVVVPEKDSFLAARSFYAVRAASPMKLDAFMVAAYEMIQAKNLDPSKESTWAAIFDRLNIPGIGAAWKAVEQKTMEKSFEKLLSYRINATPSLAIDGRYIITPENTNGDQVLFFQLANGMISKAMVS